MRAVEGVRARPFSEGAGQREGAGTDTQVRPGEQVRMHVTSSGQRQGDGEEVRPQLTERGSGGGFIRPCGGTPGHGLS